MNQEKEIDITKQETKEETIKEKVIQKIKDDILIIEKCYEKDYAEFKKRSEETWVNQQCIFFLKRLIDDYQRSKNVDCSDGTVKCMYQSIRDYEAKNASANALVYADMVESDELLLNGRKMALDYIIKQFNN